MIPATNDPRWRELVTGKTRFEFASFALKMLMARIVGQVARDPSDACIQRSIAEVHSFLVRNEEIARRDITTVFGQERN